MKRKLALGTPITQPYLNRMEEVFQITPFSQLLTPGTWPSEETVRSACMGSEVIILEADHIGAETLRAWQEAGLKLLICTRGNPVNIDVDACRRLGITLTYTPGRNAQSVAEYTFALLLMLCKQLHRSVRQIWDGSALDEPVADIFAVPDVKDVVWMNQRVNVYNTVPLGCELYEKNISLIGFGAVAKRVARIAAGFSMRVLAYDPFCPPEAFAAYGAENCTLEEVLAQGDIISVHLPVLPSTVGMIDSSWFAQMKQGALLINTARAKVIDQQAMVQALTQGKLAGAAVDVMWQEPCPANHPFLAMDNVIVSPHMAGATVDIDMWQSRLACEDLEAYLNGQPCPHVFKG